MTMLYAPAEEVWQRILTRTTVDPDGCWEWQGAVNSRGYGCASSGKKGKSALVHRVSIIVRDGSLADDMTIDHLCRNKRCVRPDHLEAVTIAENNKRGREAAGYAIGGHCGSGHELTEDSTYRHPRGQLVCRECQTRYSKQGSLWRVREWAWANGYDVAERGRLSPRVIAAYMAATQERAA